MSQSNLHEVRATPELDPRPHRRLGLDGLLRDLRFGLRHLVGRPVFSIGVVLTLAVGVGPNVAVFSVFKALVLEPLPYPEPERLVAVR